MGVKVDCTRPNEEVSSCYLSDTCQEMSAPGHRVCLVSKNLSKGSVMCKFVSFTVTGHNDIVIDIAVSSTFISVEIRSVLRWTTWVNSIQYKHFIFKCLEMNDSTCSLCTALPRFQSLYGFFAWIPWNLWPVKHTFKLKSSFLPWFSVYLVLQTAQFAHRTRASAHTSTGTHRYTKDLKGGLLYYIQ